MFRWARDAMALRAPSASLRRRSSLNRLVRVAGASPSCRTILYCTVFATALLAQAPEDPDSLYGQREDLTSAKRAAEIWSSRLERDAANFEAAWKLARAAYWLGGHLPQQERRVALEQGIGAAHKAIAARPDRPEGHFWLAATMGVLAESFGLRAGIKYRKPIREALERVLKIDPAFQQGSADRALGRWYFKVPRLFGGSKERSEQHLRKSLTYNPNSTASLFFLAETLVELDRRADAITMLQRAIEAPVDPEWAPEDREFKQKATILLKELKGR